MAKLLPSSNFSIVKSQKSGIVKKSKLLNIKSKNIILNKKPTFFYDSLLSIDKKIDKLLKESLFLYKKEEEINKKNREQERFSSKEKELEKKKPPLVKGIKLPTPPKMGFFDWIKNFITQTILGFFAVRLIDFLPQLLKILPVIIKVGDFFIDVGGKMLDGLVTFVDWGYKAIDGTRQFIKDLGGEGLAKNFDKFAGAIDNVLEVAIIAALATADSGGGGNLFDSGVDFLKRKGTQQAAQTAGRQVATQAAGQAGGTAAQVGGIGVGAAAAIVAGAGLAASALGEGAFQVKKISQKFEKNIKEYSEARKKDKNPITRALKMSVWSMFGPFLRLGNWLLNGIGVTLDIVGAPFRYAIELVRYGIMLVSGDTKGIEQQRKNLAKFDARIRDGIREHFAGFLGPIFGFMGKKDWKKGIETKGSFGNIYGNKGAQKEMMNKMAGGGKLVGGPSKRTIKKKKKPRTLSFTPRKIKPGASTGGEEKVRQVFPNPEKSWWDPFGVFTGKNQQQQQQQQQKPKGKQSNPQEFLVGSNDVLGRAKYFIGPTATLILKTVMGQKPDDLDYRNIAKGLSAFVQTTFSGGTLGFAGGGEVDAKQYFSGEDYTEVIAKTIKDSASKEVDTTIRNLSKELALRPVGRKEMLQKNMEKEKDTSPNLNIDMGPGGTVTGGNADFWTLVAISRMEDSDPQGSADVAQSIYNRVASGVYGGKSIKQIVLRNGQYEPTWKYPRRGKTGVPNPEWHAIKDIATASAATGISQSDLQKTAAALRNSKYQEEARKFVGGRTDFMGGGNKKGAEDVQRTTNAPNNFFGWFVGPAAIAYGKKNPGPAKAPQLGDIVVMGDSGGAEPLGKGYGSGGSKIAGELGRYIKQKLRQGPDFSQVHRHPEHPPYSLTSGHSRGSLHYQGRAIDIGAYTREQGPILKVISEFNRAKGVRPVQLLHGRNEPSGHSDHVHVAYEKGGETLDGPHIAMIGEKGREFVIDADSKESIDRTFPGFLVALNDAKYDEAINVLRNFASYEAPYAEPEIAFIPLPSQDSGGNYGTTPKPSLSYGGSSIDSVGEQISDSLMYG